MKPAFIELLAPAGSLETFAVAVEAGADAVYIGAPAANARALAGDFSPAELAAMIAYAHRRKVRVYAAMNSLLKEHELVRAAATVELLAGLGVDALIIQDLGLHAICRRFFPKLKLHASTLMGAHNALAVRQLVDMGFSRVVLARELTLMEIAAAGRSTEVELEVFVHGAMCFSYSGLCLFSSYFGGKSGLRGRCVQPCRRAYRWGGGRERGRGEQAKRDKPAYLFSMNDLEALKLLPELYRAGVGSVKIEGRMRSALYVDRVVRAYRLVIDAMAPLKRGILKGEPARDRFVSSPSPHNSQEPQLSLHDLQCPSQTINLSSFRVFRAALAEGRELLAEALGRKTGAGFFQPPFKELVSPEHSGNLGLFLGKIIVSHDQWARVNLRHPVRQGDRLRLHGEPSGERLAFTVRRMRALSSWSPGAELLPATTLNPAGTRGCRGGVGNGGKIAAKLPVIMSAERGMVEILLPAAVRPGDSLYKVDLADRRRGGQRPKLVVEDLHRRRVAGLAQAQPRRDIMTFLGSAAGADVGRKKTGAGARNRIVGVGAGTFAVSSVRRSPTRRFLPLWLRLDDPRLLVGRLPSVVQRVVLSLSRESWPRFAAAEKTWRKMAARIVWALPPIILADDLPFYRNKIGELQAKGFNAWQIAHFSQAQLFVAPSERWPDGDGQRSDGGEVAKSVQFGPVVVKRRGKSGSGAKLIQGSAEKGRQRGAVLTIYGDYTLNVLNSLARESCRRLGLFAVQASIETDRANLELMLGSTASQPRTPPQISTGLSIYGRPPLFTSRLDSVHFRPQAPLLSPREESFELVREDGQTLALAAQPFSLLPYLEELAAVGLAYGVIDLRRQKNSRDELMSILRWAGKKPPRSLSLASFNYLLGLA